MKVPEGVFMPTAAILCLPCHGPVFPRKTFDIPSIEWDNVTAPKELKEDYALTYCDHCGTDIQMDESIASEHNMVKALQESGIDAYMAQTGGMNPAGEIAATDGGWFNFVYNWDVGDGWHISRFNEEGEWIEEGTTHQAFFSETDFFDYVMKLEGVARKS